MPEETTDPVQVYVPTYEDCPNECVETRTLTRGGQVALWSLRRWLLARRRGENVDETLAEMFRLAGCPEATSLLDEFMALLNHCALRQIEIRCACAKTLSVDEFLMLRALRYIQKGKREEAQKRVQRLLPQPLVPIFLRLAGLFVDALGRRDISLDRLTQLRVVA
tara:strand:- start:2743 stop:3237 length:495 start_codon:yes stop_codon:yes gene_type:complete